MGVKGLWSLLNPVARPVQIESLEGKRLAIDSSIWLYQFQSTMRDKDGRVLTNAHVLGFLRRINKLLFHGIKPVFVFDGGAPALKRSTIAERKRRKQGAAMNHAKMAEKLLHAQMRREAVRLAERAEDDRNARVIAAQHNDEVSEAIPTNAVYLDQLEGRAGPSQPRKVAASASAPGAIESSSSSNNKKKYKKDRYELPDATIPAFTTDERPDARLATEAELQQFIDDVNPEDIDIESPEFRALPTEVQYEIIGDLRLRSRQQSHARLTDMLRAAPTSLDFSKAQIKHLSQRNALTQQLLTVTDMVGKAHLTIPVRVAAERNREYVLVKRDETEGGGWALGIREGTKDKPIVLEPESPVRGKKEAVEETTDSEYDSDLEPALPPPPDDDLRQHRRREILNAIAQRYAPTHSKPSLDIEVKSFGARRQPGAIPLFDPAEEDADVPDVLDIEPTANDEALALALQQEELGSDEEEADPDLARALALSRREAEVKGIHAPVADGDGSDSDQFEEVSVEPSARTTPVAEDVLQVLDSDDSDDGIEVTGVKTVSHNPVHTVREKVVVIDKGTAISPVRATMSAPVVAAARLDSSDDEFEEVDVVDTVPMMAAAGPSRSSGGRVAPAGAGPGRSGRLAALVAASRPVPVVPASPEAVSSPSPLTVPEPAATSAAPSPPPVNDRPPSPEAPSPLLGAPFEAPSPPRGRGAPSPSPERRPPSPAPDRRGPSPSPQQRTLPVEDEPMAIDSDDEMEEMEETQLNIPEPPRRPTRHHSSPAYSSEEEDADEPIEWSRSPTPQLRPQLMSRAASGHSAHSLMSEAELDDDEDGGEMAPADMVAEEDDYARFLAQIKNRDLREVRSEIDHEIAVLNQQTKAAMRDSDEITQSMVVQIQTLLRHFGIPYITAPMEAEAQCAKLAQLDLVDGIITDDSDVFLFGGTQCFKNIFNDAKFAECFLATDVERELSLTRDRLISLAYLLGSDYDVGLLGVGPVLALELLAEFPGADGLLRFKQWWLKVQSGTDLPVESDSKWKRGFKKRFAGSIHLGAEWPNAHVREAYLLPTTDESDEPFHWGFPRLHALRTFLHEELSWSISKVDDELTPIVQRIAKRGRGGEIKQGTLLSFFDHGAGTGASYAPRRRTTANISKRLMAVIKTFREAEAIAQGQQPEGWGEMLAGVDEMDPKGLGVKERVKKVKEAKGKEETAKGKRKAKATGNTTTTRKRKSKDVVEDEADDEEDELDAEEEERPRTRRRRTRSTAASDDLELVE